MGFNPRFTFKQKMLASSVAAIVGSLAQPHFANAQENASVDEEVIVTGIRRSLQQSQDIKRESKGVVDAISAEDIGKFPDSNIAESLQRITGVSISRRNGEGSQVTVRGFGPDFNMVTLNGRMMPSASIQSGPSSTFSVGGDSASRAFNMDNIASEGVAGVEVYKTSKANIASGGIGATLNLKTTRPLDNEGLKFSVGAKALQDSTNERGDDTTPELSGVLSWSNDVFGASLSLSHQERDSGSAGAFVSNWGRAFVYDPDGFIPGSADLPHLRTDGSTRVTNTPGVGQVVGEPADLRYFQTDTERERTNGQLTLQFRPVESLTVTGDVTIAEQTTVSNQHTISQWFQDFDRVAVDYDSDAVPTPVLLWEQSGAAQNNFSRDTGSAQTHFNEKNELDSFGLNVEWQANDELKLALDFNNATNTAGADKPYGSQLNFNMAVNGSFAQGVDYSGEIPTLYIDYRDDTRANQRDSDLATANNQYGIEDVGSQILQVSDDFSETEITQFRLDGTYEFSDSGSIDFGIERREMDNVSRRASTSHTLGNWSVEQPGDIPDEFLGAIDYSDYFSINTGNQEWFNSVSGGNAVPFTQGFYLRDIPGASQALLNTYDPTASFNASDLPRSLDRNIEEEIDAAYFQISLDSSLGDMPVSILAGLRYESTDITSSSDIASLVTLWQSDDDFLTVVDQNAANTLVKESASYDHLLPSLDIGLDVTDDVKARFSYSKTIARPRYNNLNVGVSTNGFGPTSPTILPGSTPGTASAGSAGLLPLESDNFDLSVEWYFDDASYASIGYFEKRVSNFIGQRPVARPVLGITDPTNGPRAQAALAALNDGSIAATDANLFSMMASMTPEAQAQGIAFADQDASAWIAWAGDNLNTDLGGGFSGNADDEPLVWSVSTPANINNAKLHGFEIAGQHFFGDTGFGVQANYTIVNGNFGFDVTADPSQTQFALQGLSDTANLSLMYENFGFSGRVSYNWRDDFLSNPAIFANEPQFTEDFQQIDISLSYEVLDGMFVSFEGINITEEDQRTYGRSERQLNTYTELGARYALGLRYTY